MCHSRATYYSGRELRFRAIEPLLEGIRTAGGVSPRDPERYDLAERLRDEILDNRSLRYQPEGGYDLQGITFDILETIIERAREAGRKDLSP